MTDSTGSADEYIDGLKVKNAPGFKHYATYTTAHSGVDGYIPDNPKGNGHGLTRAAWCTIVIAAFTVGTCTGGAFYAAGTPSSPAKAQPIPQVQVTVLVPPQPNQPVSSSVAANPVFPDTCIKAIAAATKILDAAALIASVHEKQLDLMDDAYQAIALKDTQRINAVATKQRDLGRKLSDANAAALPSYQATKDGLATCPR